MPLHTRLTGRDPTETHRASTPLELFFDLTFAVAVWQAASSLSHGLVQGNPANALLGFALVFFGIWWAWMNFTWFASAYDTDDVFYRVAVLVQMTGVLVLAAGVPRAIVDQNFAVMTAGYVVIRLALVPLWLRAAASHPEGRRCTSATSPPVSPSRVRRRSTSSWCKDCTRAPSRRAGSGPSPCP